MVIPFEKISPEGLAGATGDRELSCESKCGTDYESLQDGQSILEKFFYTGKSYMMLNGSGFIPLNESQVTAHLSIMGLEREKITPILCEIRMKNYAVYCGGLAGYPAGVYDDPRGKLLITDSPKIIKAQAGEFPIIREFLETLFGDVEQLSRFHSWMHQARANLLSRQRRPLPALALVGQRSCGKTLLTVIVQHSLGGRVGHAYRALCGDANFNDEICANELLLVDDEIASKDNRARVRLAQGIKSTLFADSVAIRRKFTDNVTLRPISALMLACNDDPEHLQTLPALDDSMADKISIMQCHKAVLPDTDWDILRPQIESELPAFLSFVESWKITSEQRDKRTGAAAWQSPEILKLLHGISDENRLLELVHQSGIALPWCGTATELEGVLTNDPTTGQAARKLLSWNKACGTYLGRLVGHGVAKMGQRGGIQQYQIEDFP